MVKVREDMRLLFLRYAKYDVGNADLDAVWFPLCVDPDVSAGFSVFDGVSEKAASASSDLR